LNINDLVPTKDFRVNLVENENSLDFDIICKELLNEPILGFDTEFTNGPRLTYVQLSSERMAAVFNLHKMQRTPKLTDFMSKIFESKIKIIGFAAS